MVVEVTKKKKHWLSIAKMLQNAKKRFISIIRNYFTLENLTSLYRKVKETFLLHLCLKSSLSANKKCDKKLNKFLIFRLCKFPPEI